MQKSDKSDGYSTDEGKRKRGEDEQEGIFAKSKKLSRTPDKNKKTEDKIDKIMEMMNVVMQELREIKVEQREIKEGQRAMEEENRKYMEELKGIKMENEEIKKQNQELKVALEAVNKKLESIERDKRRNNIVVQGVTINDTKPEVLVERMKDFIEGHVGVKVSVKNARKLGNKTCLVELENRKDKMEVMKSKSKLRQHKDVEVYINDDMTKVEREIQGKIRKVAQQERERGKRVKIGYQKIIIDGQQYRWNREEEKLERILSKN